MIEAKGIRKRYGELEVLNLDSASSQELHRLFFKLRDRFRQTFAIVTHNAEPADMADRELTMVDGLIS